MSWIVVGVAGASLLASQMNNSQMREDKKKEMMANADAMQNSPWTGMQTQVMGQSGQGSVGAGVQGAAAGAMMGSQFKKAFADDAAKKPNTMTAQNGSNNQNTIAGGFGDQGNPYDDWMKA